MYTMTLLFELIGCLALSLAEGNREETNEVPVPRMVLWGFPGDPPSFIAAGLHHSRGLSS